MLPLYKQVHLLETRSATAKIIDFGISRVKLQTNATQTKRHHGKVTDSASGSPMYRSPECTIGSEFEPQKASDIWSFGATMFEVSLSVFWYAF